MTFALMILALLAGLAPSVAGPTPLPQAGGTAPVTVTLVRWPFT